MSEATQLSLEERSAATYRNDILKAPFYGILEAGWLTFVLLIAIRQFDAPEAYKAFIAGAAPIGFLLTPITIYFAAKTDLRPSLICALMFCLTALLIVGATVIESLLLFSVFMITSQMASVQQGPLITQLYAENYPASWASALRCPLYSVLSVLFCFHCWVGDCWTSRWIITTLCCG